MMQANLVVTPQGRFWFNNPDDYIARTIRRDGHWELFLCQEVAALLAGRHTVRGLDVGANVGLFSIQLAQLLAEEGQELEVTAFEVQPETYQTLVRNIEMNGLSGRVAPRNQAIGARAGTLEFDILDTAAARNTGAFSLLPEVTRHFSLNLPVRARGVCEVVSIADTVMAGIDFIKLDVEGMELEIVRSILPGLAAHAPILSIEVWGEQKAPWSQAAGAELLGMLRQIYAEEIVKGENHIFHGRRPPSAQLADLLRRNGHAEAAAAQYRSLAAADPGWAYMAGVCCREAGLTELALTYLQRHELRRGPDVHSRLQTALCHQTALRFDLAKRTMLEALDCFPGSKDLLGQTLRLVLLAVTAEEKARLEAYAEGDPDCVELLRNAVLTVLGSPPRPATELRAAMRAAGTASARRGVLNGILRRGEVPFIDRALLALPKPVAPAPIFAFWDRSPPREVAENFASWATMTSLSQPVWSDETARAFLQRHLDAEAVAAFDRAHHPAMRSDLFRLAKVLIDGGVYIDADERAIGEAACLWAILDAAGLDRAFVIDVAASTCYSHNYMISARAGDPVIDRALRSAIRNTLAGGGPGRIWMATGPGNLTAALCDAIAEDEDGLLRTGFITSIAFRRIFTGAPMAYKADPALNWRNH